jgi:CHAT domain-containing protein
VNVRELRDKTSAMQSELRQLDSGAVALYTLVGHEKYRVILVTREVMLARDYPIGAAELRRKVLTFRLTLRASYTDPKRLAQELYKILVGPVAAELEGAQATTLMWSVDDVLRYLPIAALHDGHDYLVAKYRNEIFTFASIPHLSDHPDVKKWRGLGMGVSKAYGQFDALPSVPEELHRIIRETETPGSEGVLPGETMLDEAFTEDNMKKALEDKYPLVHIASHFDFEPGKETNSFLLLGGADPQGQHLTLSDIRVDPKFDFNDTDLLTLSACNTAMGGIAGDGSEVDGFGILAQQKGAKSVVATLWAVNDESTGILMQEFYRLWTTHAGMPKAEALRQAQLAFLHGNVAAEPTSSQSGFAVDGRSGAQVMHNPLTPYSHPYYWAPFILIGNWN